MTLAEKVSRVFKRLRQDRGFSQAEVAEKLDIARATVSRWESADAGFMTIQQLEATASILGVQPEELLGSEPATKAALPELSVQLSPELYEHLFVIQRLTPSSRATVLEFARRAAGIIDDQARTAPGKRTAG